MKTTYSILFGNTFLVLAVFGFCNSTPTHAGGLVAAWGNNTFHQTWLPSSVVDVKAIAAGEFHCLALKADGRVVAWGDNTYGQTRIPPGLTDIVAIAGGLRHCLALQANGRVVAWGNNLYGQTNVPPGLSNVVSITAGGYHNLALTSDGRVVGWGDTNAFQPFPSDGLANVKAISAGGYHSLALKTDGSVVAWGYNNDGLTNLPPGLSGVVAIAAGQYHDMALKADGTVVAWGRNNYSQTNAPPGLAGVVAISVGVNHSLALKAEGNIIAWGDTWDGAARVPPGLSNVTAMAAGGWHNLALVSEGPIRILQEPVSQPYASNVTFSVVATGHEPLSYQWYFNGLPMSQNNIRFSGTTTPALAITNVQLSDFGSYAVLVSNPFGSVISSGADLVSPPFITQQPAERTVRAGSDVTLTAAASGTPPLLYQWNFNGTDLPGATFPTLSLYNVQPTASGAYFLTVTNSYGSTQTISASLSVTDSAPYILRHPYVRLPDQSTTTNTVVPISGSVVINLDVRGSLPLNYQWRLNGVEIPGATNSTLVLTNLRYDQTGFYNVEISNVFGTAIGDKVFLNVSQVIEWDLSPAANLNVPAGLSNVNALAIGDAHITALRSDGTVKSWFIGFPGYYPNATNVPASASNVVAIAAGLGHSLALRASGTVVDCGYNSGVQSNVFTTLSNVIAITAGGNSSFAVRSNGTVVGLGGVPFPAGLSNVVAVAAGTSHNLALRQDGTLLAWGSIPALTNLPVGLSNLIAIAAGTSHSLALKSDGRVVAWSPYASSIATNVPPTLSNVVAIAAGRSYSLALKADGTLVEWGNTGRYLLSAGLSNVTAIAAGLGSTLAAAVIGDGSPAITLHPVSQLVQKGASVQLHARAAGLQPMTYQWQFENQNLSGATNASLLIPNAQGKDTGRYRMIVSNLLGTVASRTAWVTIPYNTNLAAALNTNNWQWSNERTTNWFAQIRKTHDGNVAAQSGAILNNQQSTLQTVITGPGTLTFWWSVSSEEGFDFLRFYVDSTVAPLFGISGEQSWEQRSIHIGTGSHPLRWIYSKDVSVSAGRDAGWLDEVVFTPDPPVIAQQPTPSRILPAGVSTTFSVSVTGLGPFSYQWFKAGASLSGATQAILSLPKITRRDSATYRVQVSNAGGSATSSNATLKVIVPQELSSLRFTADGGIELLSNDADGGSLLPDDLLAFEVQTSTNLVDWESLPDVLSLTNGALLLRDLNARSVPKRFYRVVEH